MRTIKGLLRALTGWVLGFTVLRVPKRGASPLSFAGAQKLSDLQPLLEMVETIEKAKAMAAVASEADRWPGLESPLLTQAELSGIDAEMVEWSEDRDDAEGNIATMEWARRITIAQHNKTSLCWLRRAYESSGGS